MSNDDKSQADVSGPRVLTEQEKTWILEDTFQSVQIDQTLRKVEMSRREFSLYLKRDLEFKELYEQAMLDACQFLENDLLNIYKKSNIDHKLARVAIESINKILVFRNPSKYSQKIDLNVNQNISIRSNIEAGNKRVAALMKDVTLSTTLGVPVIEAPKNELVEKSVEDVEKAAQLDKLRGVLLK